MANEKRLIDANALVPYLWTLFKFFGSIPCTEADKATQRGIKRCIGEIKKMPTVDAVEVKHGRWKNNHCTVCGMMPMGEELWEHLVDCEPPRMERFMDYCPNCGAKMDGGNKDD